MNHLPGCDEKHGDSSCFIDGQIREARPFYEDNAVRLYHGDCRVLVHELERPDHVFTDPPYSEKTHAGARTGTAQRPKSLLASKFSAISASEVARVFGQFAPKRWLVSFLDWRHMLRLADDPPDGLDWVRFGVWDKPNPTPQFSGDRPGIGFEAIAILHALGRKRWNGGGRRAVWRYNKIAKGSHPTEKPLDLVTKLIEEFTDPGDLILDPFAGVGTTLRAAKNTGRRAIGIELDPTYCEIAAQRMRQEVLAL